MEGTQNLHFYAELFGVFHGGVLQARLFCRQLANPKTFAKVRTMGQRRIRSRSQKSSRKYEVARVNSVEILCWSNNEQKN